MFATRNASDVSTSAFPASQAMLPENAMRRVVDLIIACALIIFTLPCMAIVALAIKSDSFGPVFYRQERVGLNGRRFMLLKFRSMVLDAEPDGRPVWAAERDIRITRVGRFIRCTHIDELPQLFNVLCGDMSVVGPRPERPVLVQRFMQSVGNYNTRHYLKVGITGWAQVNGWRGDTSIEKRVEYDLYYVRNWTLAFDLFIVVLTLFRGFTDKNAY